MNMDHLNKYNPHRVTCPTCGRLPGQVCVNSRGESLFGRPHRRRRKLDRELLP